MAPFTVRCLIVFSLGILSVAGSVLSLRTMDADISLTTTIPMNLFDDDTGTNTSSPTSTLIPAASALPMTIVIPIVVILAFMLLAATSLNYRVFLRRWLHARFPSHISPSSHIETDESGQPLTRTLTRTLTAEELLSASPSVRRAANQRATGARGRVIRVDRLRRTESGRSVRTLPAYSKQPGDEELVLVRQRSTSSSMDVVSEEGEDHSPTSRLPVEDAAPMDEDHAGDLSMRHSDPLTTEAQDAVTTYRQSLVGSGPSDSVPLGGDLTRNSAGSTSRRGWGEAPSYTVAAGDYPLRSDAHHPPSTALSNDHDLEHSAVPAPRTPDPQSSTFDLAARTKSGIKHLFNRSTFAPSAMRHVSSPPSNTHHTHSHSLSSLLLSPQTTRSSFTPQPPIQGQEGSTPTSALSPWQSTTSLNISSPLPHSAIRASFDSSHLPKGGLSELQMKFLGSSEALSLAGVRLDDPPRSARGRRRGVSDSGSATVNIAGNFVERGNAVEDVGMKPGNDEAGGELPSWDQVEGERRRDQAFDRRNLGRPVDRDFELDITPHTDERHSIIDSSSKFELGTGQNGTSSATVEVQSDLANPEI